MHIYSGTKAIAEYVGGTLDKEYIYLGAQLLATIDKSVSPEVVTYHHNDHLSARVSTDSTGAMLTGGEQGHYPFGEEWYKGAEYRSRSHPSLNPKAPKGGGEGTIDYDYWGLGTDVIGAVLHLVEVARNKLTGGDTDPCVVRDRLGLPPVS